MKSQELRASLNHQQTYQELHRRVELHFFLPPPQKKKTNKQTNICDIWCVIHVAGLNSAIHGSVPLRKSRSSAVPSAPAVAPWHRSSPLPAPPTAPWQKPAALPAPPKTQWPGVTTTPLATCRDEFGLSGFCRV